MNVPQKVEPVKCVLHLNEIGLWMFTWHKVLTFCSCSPQSRCKCSLFNGWVLLNPQSLSCGHAFSLKLLLLLRQHLQLSVEPTVNSALILSCPLEHYNLDRIDCNIIFGKPLSSKFLCSNWVPYLYMDQFVSAPGT
jgi:hypothetical protein